MIDKAQFTMWLVSVFVALSVLITWLYTDARRNVRTLCTELWRIDYEFTDPIWHICYDDLDTK